MRADRLVLAAALLGVAAAAHIFSEGAFQRRRSLPAANYSSTSCQFGHLIAKNFRLLLWRTYVQSASIVDGTTFIYHANDRGGRQWCRAQHLAELRSAVVGVLSGTSWPLSIALVGGADVMIFSEPHSRHSGCPLVLSVCDARFIRLGLFRSTIQSGQRFSEAHPVVHN